MTQEDFFSGSVSLGQNHGGLNTSSSLIYNRAGNFCKSSFKHKKCNGSMYYFYYRKVFDPPCARYILYMAFSSFNII